MVGEMNDFTSLFSCCALCYHCSCAYVVKLFNVSYLIHGFGWVMGSLVVRNLPLISRWGCVIVDALLQPAIFRLSLASWYCLVNVQFSFTHRSLADVIMFVFIRARFILIAIFGHCVTRFEPLHCRSRSICPRG